MGAITFTSCARHAILTRLALRTKVFRIPPTSIFEVVNLFQKVMRLLLVTIDGVASAGAIPHIPFVKR